MPWVAQHPYVYDHCIAVGYPEELLRCIPFPTDQPWLRQHRQTSFFGVFYLCHRKMLQPYKSVAYKVL